MAPFLAITFIFATFIACAIVIVRQSNADNNDRMAKYKKEKHERDVVKNSINEACEKFAHDAFATFDRTPTLYFSDDDNGNVCCVTASTDGSELNHVVNLTIVASCNDMARRKGVTISISGNSEFYAPVEIAQGPTIDDVRRERWNKIIEALKLAINHGNLQTWKNEAFKV